MSAAICNGLYIVTYRASWRAKEYTNLIISTYRISKEDKGV